MNAYRYGTGPKVANNRRSEVATINEWTKYLPGTSLHVRAGKPHVPHSTEKGCTLLLLWTDKAAITERQPQ